MTTTLAPAGGARTGAGVLVDVGGVHAGRGRSLRAYVGPAVVALILALFAACAGPAPDWTGRVGVDGRVYRVKVRAGRTYCRGGCPPGLAACAFTGDGLQLVACGGGIVYVAADGRER